MSSHLCCDVALAIFIALISVPLVPVYLVLLVPILIIAKLVTCCKLGIFEFYLQTIFFPATLWLCYVYTPFYKLKHGRRVLYLGTLVRDESIKSQQTIAQNIYNNNNNDYKLVNINNLPNISQDNKLSYQSLNENFKSSKKIRIVCISDTHCRHDFISDLIVDGDILIHCGDITLLG